MGVKLPALMLYTGDWLADSALRSVSLAARGLWIDVLCQMSENNRRGFLQIAGKPMTTQKLARVVGASENDVCTLLAELREAGIFSEDPEHGIYSRRMVRDEAQREVYSRAGKAGGGNPNFKKQGSHKKEYDKGEPKGSDKGGSKGDSKGQSKGDDNQNANPSITVSSSFPASVAASLNPLPHAASDFPTKGNPSNNSENPEVKEYRKYVNDQNYDPPDTVFGDFIFYVRLWQQCQRVEYPAVNPKRNLADIKRARQSLADGTSARDLMGLFFRSADDFIKSRGFLIEDFVQRIPALVPKANNTKQQTSKEEDKPLPCVVFPLPTGHKKIDWNLWDEVAAELQPQIEADLYKTHIQPNASTIERGKLKVYCHTNAAEAVNGELRPRIEKAISNMLAKHSGQ